MRPRIAFFTVLDRSTAAMISALAEVGDICAIVARTSERRARQKIVARRWLAPDWSFAANLRKGRQRPRIISGAEAGHDARLISALSDCHADLLVSALYPRRISSDILKCFRRGALNIHPARLPEVAGPQPVHWLISQDTWRKWGEVTLHVMDDGLDTGPILSRATMAETAFAAPHDYKTRFAGAAAALITSAVPDWLAGRLTPEPQLGPTGRIWAASLRQPIPLEKGWSADRLIRAQAFLGRSPGLAVEVDGAAVILRGVPRVIGPGTGEAATLSGTDLSFDLEDARILVRPTGWLQGQIVRNRNRLTWSRRAPPAPTRVQVATSARSESTDQIRAADAPGSGPRDRS